MFYIILNIYVHIYFDQYGIMAKFYVVFFFTSLIHDVKLYLQCSSTTFSYNYLSNAMQTTRRFSENRESSCLNYFTIKGEEITV